MGKREEKHGKTEYPQEETAQQELDVKFITIQIEITKPFHNFLKEYLAFFGSGMSIEGLVQQMVYNETRRLHRALTAFTTDDGNDHYVGWIPWLRRHPKVAETIKEYPQGIASATEATKETPAADTQPKQ